MKQLIRYAFAASLCAMSGAVSFGQIIMHAGDVWVHQAVLPFRGLSFELTNFPVRARIILEFDADTFTAGESIRCDIFENHTAEPPSTTATFDGPLSRAVLDAPEAWSDRQGAVRLTMLTGAATLTNVWMKRLEGGPSGQTHDYSTNLTYAPRFLRIERMPPFVWLEWTNYGSYRVQSVGQAGSTNWQTLSSGSATGIVSTVVFPTDPAQLFRIVHP